MDNTLKKDITSQSNTAVPTITFTEEHMGNLLTAYQSLRELEKLLTIISGIDPENGILCNLRHMDNLIQDLSPLFDSTLDYDEQVYTKVLVDDSLSIPLKSMMEALNFSHTNKFAQIYGEIYDLEVQNDMEKKLDVLANSISTSSSLIERECFMNDYVISTLSPGSTMQISGSYENIDRCVRKLEIVESKKEKAELIADYCYYSCVLGFEYELLKQEPYLDLVLFAISEDASVFWEKSAYCKMYSHCIDKLEESFSMDLEEWREKSPYSTNAD